MTAAPTKPWTLDVRTDAIARDLTLRRGFVGWTWELRAGAKGKPAKWTKPPRNVRTGGSADSTDPATWGTFDEAIAAYERGETDGIGFACDAHPDLVAVDLDHCVSRETGELEPWALAIVEAIQSYTEISPSGTGLRILVYGTLPEGGRKRGNVEVYETGRYVTLTGHRLPGTPEAIEHRQADIEAFHREHFPARETHRARGDNGATPHLSDHDVLDRAFGASNGARVRAIYQGDDAMHNGDASAADLALISHLTFWTQDRAQLDRLFRGSPRMRAKWDARHYGDGRTYGEGTIDMALSSVRETYGTRYAETRDYAETPSDDDLSALPRITAYPGPMADEAFYSLAGDVVRAIDPVTEADPAAVLIQFLVAFGSAAGRGSHFRVEGDRHGLNLDAAIVGDTSKARKGTSWGRVLDLMRDADHDWATGRIAHGLSSGEGLIWAVRDPIQKTEPIKDSKTKEITGYQDVIVDEGVEDKRLLIVESELASTLRVLQRDGNILSAVLRQAWDSGDLRTLTKNTPAVATGAHVSIIGHITSEELRRYLDRTEVANGLGNRILWLCAKRSKTLPEGGGAIAGRAELVDRIAFALDMAQAPRELRRDDEAREVWAAVYPDLSEGTPGLLGAMTARGEAQVMRLAATYAALDRSPLIRLPHLHAALAVWDYVTASVAYIFGDALGDPVADDILRALRERPEGMTRNELRDLFGRNKSSEQIGRALASLAALSLAYCEREDTGGRPAERWRASGVRKDGA